MKAQNDTHIFFNEPDYLTQSIALLDDRKQGKITTSIELIFKTYST